MKSGIRRTVALTGGLILSALYAWPQTYTISAKPGVVNYIEGTAFLNGAKLSDEAVRSTFLTAGEKISTQAGKVEILLTPGVFLRVGGNSEIQMISPSLTDTQIGIIHGEAMVEAAGLMKDNNVRVTDHGASITIEKNGLYRFRADNEPSVAVLDGKALVYYGQKKIELGKDHEATLGDALDAEKFDPKQEDELYAWSNVRSEYEAASSYQSAQSASINSYGGGWGQFGYGGLYGSGWLWNSAFGGYSWLPGYGAFYSPFGWGFYSPGAVGYAPVVTAPVYSGGGWSNNPNWKGHHWVGKALTASVPIQTNHPPAVGVIAASPLANQQARVQAAQALASTGSFNPAGARSSSFVASSHVINTGALAVRGGSGWSGSGSGGHPASTGGSSGGWSGGGFSGGAARGSGMSTGSFASAGGGGHASAGGGGGGGGGGHH